MLISRGFLQPPLALIRNQWEECTILQRDFESREKTELLHEEHGYNRKSLPFYCKRKYVHFVSWRNVILQFPEQNDILALWIEGQIYSTAAYVGKYYLVFDYIWLEASRWASPSRSREFLNVGKKFKRKLRIHISLDFWERFDKGTWKCKLNIAWNSIFGKGYNIRTKIISW